MFDFTCKMRLTDQRNRRVFFEDRCYWDRSPNSSDLTH